MENITMITPAFDAALVCATDRFIGGTAGVVSARDRFHGFEPTSAFVSDPRPVGPPV